MSSSSSALGLPRAASLFLAFAFGIVGLALNVSAFVKSGSQKSAVRGAVPPGTLISLDDSDVVATGTAVAVFSAIVGVASLASLGLHLVLPTLAARTRPLQGAILAVASLGLFGALVAMTDFVATRELKVSATIGGTPVPAAIVQSVEQALNVTPVYHKIGYLKNATILPWFAFLFGVTSTVFSFVGGTRPAPAVPAQPELEKSPKNSILEQSDPEKQDKV